MFQRRYKSLISNLIYLSHD